MNHEYKKTTKIKYNNKIFQILVREDNKMGFLRIVDSGEEKKYEYPTAQEFLHLSSVLNVNNNIKF